MKNENFELLKETNILIGKELFRNAPGNLQIALSIIYQNQGNPSPIKKDPERDEIYTPDYYLWICKNYTQASEEAIQNNFYCY